MAGASSYIALKNTASTATIKESIYPTLYSDDHITENAKIADPRFQSVAIADREDLVASATLSLQTNKPLPDSTESENGTWLWTPTLDITPSYRNYIIQNAKKNGIKNIYLSIDSYLDIFVMSDSPEKKRREKAFGEVLTSFIREANKNGITVDAEAGWRNWAEDGHVYKPLAILDYVIAFNKTHEEKFRGFQYDVEPYVLPYYQNNKKDVLRNYLKLVNETVTRLNNNDLAFSVVIPEFYDGAEGLTPRFFYAWNYSHAIDHLLRILERRPGSSIIVMSYRNFAEGENGSIAISEDEIRKADRYKSKIIIAQETGDVEPPFITFHKTSRKLYNTQVTAIENAFTENKSYNGTATHYINTFLELK